MAMVRNTTLEALKVADAQRKRASLDILTSKRQVEKEVTIVVPGEDGPEEMTLLFRSIGSKEYDRLVTSCPPRADQKREGSSYDIDKFGPELISRVCVDPVMTVEDARAIWNSEHWNRGEVWSLFSSAVEVCTNGLEVGPTNSG
jgi:hypothetical protein